MASAVFPTPPAPQTTTADRPFSSLRARRVSSSRQDREFVAAIRESRPSRSSVAEVLPCYEVLHRLDTQLTT